MTLCGMLVSATAEDKLVMLEEHIQGCEFCNRAAYIIKKISAMKAGRTKSLNKSLSSRINGLKGGRPKK